MLPALQPSQKAVWSLGFLWGLRFRGRTGAATAFALSGAHQCNLQNRFGILSEEGNYVREIMCDQRKYKKVGEEAIWLAYTVSLSRLFFSQLGFSLAAALLPVLLLLPEALLLLQSQCDPQGPSLLLLDLGAV